MMVKHCCIFNLPLSPVPLVKGVVLYLYAYPKHRQASLEQTDSDTLKLYMNIFMHLETAIGKQTKLVVNNTPWRSEHTVKS